MKPKEYVEEYESINGPCVGLNKSDLYNMMEGYAEKKKENAVQATLKFDLPEAQMEFLAAVNATSMAWSLHEILNNVRRKYLKYKDLTDDQYDLVEEIFDDIRETVDVDIDKIVE